MADWRDAINERLTGLRLHPTRAAEIAEELSQHLDDRYRELRAAGVRDDEARAATLAELAAPGFLADRLEGAERLVDPEPPVPGARGESWRGALRQDLRYALRTLRANPGFAIVAIVTLALGIGATTAIFSVVDAAMLRPLPFEDADRLVRIWESDVARGRPEFSMSQPNFLDFRSRNRSFAYLAATVGVGMRISTPDGVEPTVARAVSVDFLPAIGGGMALGRGFQPDEDRPGARARVIVITHGFWQRQFGGDPGVVGKTVTLNDAAYTVIGVLPKTFGWVVPGLDLLTPLAADPAQARGDHRLTVIGRLKPGVSLDQATADLKAIAAGLSEQFPESNKGWSVLLRSFYDWIVPAETRRLLLVFLAAVAFVLLIAATNVANLMLARAAARQKEMSIRVALGAGRGRLLAQMLVESVLLAVVAGALGCGLAVAATRVLKAMGPATIPRLDEVGVNGTALLFALAVSVGIGVLFGLAPALQASRPNVNSALKDGGRGSGTGGRQRMRHALVVVEVALSVALLVGAGLLVRSLWRLQHVDPGYDPHNLLTMQVTLIGPAYQSDAQYAGFFQRTIERIGALPGVTSAAASSIVPLGGGNTSIEVVIDGRQADAAGVLPSADWRVVSDGYFRTLGVAVRGRDFDARDTGESRSVIISQEMARRYWPDTDPIGREFHWHALSGPRMTIVGVAADMRHLALETEPAPIIYLPLAANRWNPMFFTIRTASDPAGLTAAARAAIRAIDPKLLVTSVRTGDGLLDASLGPRRFNMVLLATFAGVALVLASVGLFGVMSYLVSQRARDIGVRLALGALPRDVFGLIIGRGLLLASAGAAVGVVAAFWLSRSLATLLFGVQPTDPATFASVVALLLAVTCAACYLPARRATRVDPVIALRAE